MSTSSINMVVTVEVPGLKDLLAALQRQNTMLETMITQTPPVQSSHVTAPSVTSSPAAPSSAASASTPASAPPPVASPTVVAGSTPATSVQASGTTPTSAATPATTAPAAVTQPTAPPATIPVETPPATTDGPTIDDVRAVLQKLAAQQGREVAIGLLQQHGAANVGALVPEKYAAVVQAANDSMALG